MYSKLLSFLFLFAFTPVFATQSERCQTVLGTDHGVPAHATTKQQGEKVLLEASRWLEKEAANISPSETHLQGLVPLMKQYLADLRAALPTKSDQPLYAVRSGQILQILDEAQQRMESHQLTYDFIFALPIRISMFLNMEVPLAEQPGFYFQSGDKRKNENGVAPSLEESSYLKHENFMSLVKELSNTFYSSTPYFVARKADGFSFWIYVDLGLKNFKTAKLLPFFGEISIETMNEMSDAGVWPLGTFLKPVTLDGLNYTERGATLHDLIHATNYFFDSTARANYLTPPILLDVLDQVKRETYAQIKKSTIQDQDQQWLFQFLQYILFHEIGRDTYQVGAPIDRERRAEVQASVRAIRTVFRGSVYSQLSSHIPPGRKDPFFNHLRAELAAKFPSEQERTAQLRLAVPQFENFLEQAMQNLK